MANQTPLISHREPWNKSKLIDIKIIQIHVGRTGIAFRIRLGALALSENGDAKNCYRACILMLFKKACMRRACNALCNINLGSCRRAKSFFAYEQQVMQA